MEIYLDANATTPVLPEARAAALAAMDHDYGNPSSVHSTGLKARALMDSVRARARRVLRVTGGHLLFVSGATEGIQTAVLSAMTALRDRRSHGTAPDLVLYGATEHKAVPEAIRHWNEVLRLGLEVMVIPVDGEGRHDLAWLRLHAPRAGLVCTMAVNNETGVVSDLDGIDEALKAGNALWLVDGVQALGKIDLRLGERRIDYVPFSGHKLYAPKGIGLLYVRDGAPVTPLLAGGGQEESLRSGTENMPGIAALGAVLAALEEGRLCQSHDIMTGLRGRLVRALRDAFPALAFNAPESSCLPTTLNFSVPGLSSKLLLDLFDAAGLRVSGGSACSSSKAQPSYVLEAMGLPAWQSASAVRLSFGPATEAAVIDEACRRIRICGESLRVTGGNASAPQRADTLPRITRHVVDGACCYVVVDPASRRCVVVDPLPELTETLARAIADRRQVLVAVLDTHSHGDHASSAKALRAALPAGSPDLGSLDDLGWPIGVDVLALGGHRLTRLAIPGHTRDSTAYLLHDAHGGCLAFVGDTVMPGALGRSDFAQSDALAFPTSLRRLASSVGLSTLLLPGHDYDDRYACTLATECVHQPLLAAAIRDELDPAAFAARKEKLEEGLAAASRGNIMPCGSRVDGDIDHESVALLPAEVVGLMAASPGAVLVDVREAYEQWVGESIDPGPQSTRQAAPLSGFIDALRDWIALPDDTPLLFFCRSGNRSAVAAAAVRRLGHARAFSVAGGLALWPGSVAARRSKVAAHIEGHPVEAML